MTEVLNILIVVDVQNCFIANPLDTRIRNVAEKVTDYVNSIEQSKNITTLIDSNKLIIFTRDFHPLGHSSFEIFGAHCRSNNTPCDCTKSIPVSDLSPELGTVPKNGSKPALRRSNRVQLPDSIPVSPSGPLLPKLRFQYGGSALLPGAKSTLSTAVKLMTSDIESLTPQLNSINTFLNTVTRSTDYCTLKDYEISGSNLSYLFKLDNKYSIPISKLIEDVEKHTIRKKPNIHCSEQCDLIHINYMITPVDYFSNGVKTKSFIQLNKGEFCSQDSFSAFNYHVDFPKTGPHNMKTLEKNSTGLWEYIHEFHKINSESKLNITVCGLVGNICVIHTILQGIHTYNSFYTKHFEYTEIIFNYDISGTLFMPNYPDNKHFAKSKYTKEDLTDEVLMQFFKYFDTLLPDKHTNIQFNITHQGEVIIKYSSSDKDKRLTKSGIPFYKNDTNKYIKYKQKYLNLSNKY